jgi:2'-5' RNA ligase
MALAISLKGVNDTADPIRALWEEVARLESRPSMAALNYPPHLTLAVYDDVPPVQVRDALREAFAGRSALRLTFTRLRFFDDPLVLWAEPLPSADLTSAHAKVHALIDPRHCHPHYRPGAWVPHCTLGTQILLKYREEALALATHSIPTFEVVFDVADCVSFAPVAVMAEQPLCRPGRPHASS